MEVLTAMIGKVVESVLAPASEAIKRRYNYAFNYDGIVDDLRNQVDKLKNARDRVQHDVDRATRQLGEEIEADVQQWLTRASAVLEENSKFLEDAEEAKKKSRLVFCPNLKSRYGVAKTSQKRAELVVKCYGESTFQRVSYPPHWIGDRSSGDYEAFESRMPVLNEIVEALKDPDVDIVGVYGMPGIGKTTLVKKIAEQVKEDGMFDMVVLAFISQTPNLRKIQGEIADGLDFKLDAETVSGRADRLRERLKKEKKMLIILDDIWEELKLEDVGIPIGKEKLKLQDDRIPVERDYRVCKILMTSRNRKVLSHQMGAKETFMLPVLIENEAWNLFEKMAGHVVKKNPAFSSVAIEVAKRCGGLPILLVTVARALKDGDLSDWKDALGQLQRIDNDEMDAQVYGALELSFNHLKDDEVKSLFLLCGQLRANRVWIIDLLKYVVGFGLFKRTRSNTLEDARIRLHELINDLKASCLLVDGEEEGTVKMDDVVHKFAISYASRYRNVLNMSSDESKEWPSNAELKQCTGIFLVDREIPELPTGLECPKVESFILYNDSNSSLKIPDDLFRGIRKIRVMDLSDVHLSQLPSSLQFLENLQTLCLDRCELRDLAMIGKLKMLHVLSLMGSNVVRLPMEIGELTRLQLLDLSDNPTLEVIPPNVLSRLTQLEDLYLENSFVQWEIERLDTKRHNASLAELKHLSKLVTLDIHITDAENLPKDLLFQKLERFRIFIGDVWDWSGKYETTKTLKLELASTRSFHLEDGIQALLKKTEDLYLHELKGIKSVLYELDGQGFSLLKHLHIQSSPEIQYLVDSTMMRHCVAFRVLESLSLDNLENLKEICHGQPMTESFTSLRILKVARCHRLKSLFSLSMASQSLKLEEINVNDCKVMEVIFAEDQSEGDTNRDEAMKFTRLRALTLERLPKFTSIRTNTSIPQTRPNLLASNARSTEIVSENEHGTPIPLFNKKIIFPNLQDLKLSLIQVEKIWDDQLVDDLRHCIQKLTSLEVEDCDKLKYLFTSSMVTSLAQLKRLEISGCKIMEKIIVPEGESGSSRSYCIQKLTSLTVEDCGKSKCLFSSTMAKSLAKLKRLLIRDRKLMEEIIDSEGENGTHMLVFPELERLTVQRLPKLTKFCTTDLIECPSLEYLWIDECPEMKTFVGSKSNYTMNNSDAACTSTAYEVEKTKSSSVLFDEKVAFPKLYGLKISNMNRLEKIWHSELRPDSFCKLKTLNILHGEELLEIFPPSVLRRFQNLENLVVHNCDSIKEVFDLQSLRNEKEKRATMATPRGILSFQNLRSIAVSQCQSLKSIFPAASVALACPQLEHLSISDCGVEEIVSEERVKEFPFPKLTFLELLRLPYLRRLYPRMHTLEWPALKRLRVYHCHKIPIFDSSEIQISQGTCFGDQIGDQTKQPLFSFGQIISNLEQLTLTIKDTTMICYDQFPPYLFHKLKHLELQCFHNEHSAADFPLGLLKRFHNLEKLVVSCGHLKELFSSRLVNEEDKNARETLARIRYLRVYNLPDLQHIWNQDFPVDQLIPNLETLQVWDCNSLINLAPPTASFQKLKSLDVWRCKGMTYLITSSTAKALVQLTAMSIRECDMVTKIVAISEGDEGENEIIFRQLESLTLDYLPRLISFCSTSLNFKFPFLTEVTVTVCPNMKAFSHGILRTPKLQKVWMSKEKDKGQWKGDLNKTIMHIHTAATAAAAEYLEDS